MESRSQKASLVSITALALALAIGFLPTPAFSEVAYAKTADVTTDESVGGVSEGIGPYDNEEPVSDVLQDLETEGRAPERESDDGKNQSAPEAEGEDSSIAEAVLANSGVSIWNGVNRYDTNRLSVTESWDTSQYAVVVSGEDANWPDTAVGSGIAGILGAPIVLTSSSSLSPEARTSLASLGCKTVYVIGGTPSISTSTENQIKAILGSGGTVIRIAGADRAETAELACRAFGQDSWQHEIVIGHNYAPVRGAVFVSSDSAPDSLSATNLAYINHCPVFFVPSSGVIPESTISLLGQYSFNRMFFIGNSIPDSTISQVKNAVDPRWTFRIAGADRYETSALVLTASYLDECLPTLSPNKVAMATGETFVDGRSGVGRDRGLLLINPSNPTSAITWMTENNHNMDYLAYLGGIPRATSDSITQAWLNG